MDNIAEEKAPVLVPISYAARRLLMFKVPLEEVREAFSEIYPVIFYLDIEALLSVKDPDDITQADIIAIFLCGFLQGNNYVGCSTVASAWQTAVEKHGWFDREEVVDE